MTLVSWGAMMHETLLAAETLAKDGVSAEIIDLATVAPYDVETIIESVEKTGRCVIVAEAVRTGGVASDIAAELAERCLLSLIAPVGRVTGYDTIMPYAKLEGRYLPSVERIVDEVRKVMAFS